jgi:hypothetical protein
LRKGLLSSSGRESGNFGACLNGLPNASKALAVGAVFLSTGGHSDTVWHAA